MSRVGSGGLTRPRAESGPAAMPVPGPLPGPAPGPAPPPVPPPLPEPLPAGRAAPSATGGVVSVGGLGTAGGGGGGGGRTWGGTSVSTGSGGLRIGVRGTGAELRGAAGGRCTMVISRPPPPPPPPALAVRAWMSCHRPAPRVIPMSASTATRCARNEIQPPP